jgi:ABC-2 type transport system permease protein
MTTSLRAYRTIIATRIQLGLQYRAAALAGFLTQCWWGAIRVMVLAAFYGSGKAAPISLGDTISYIWLGQAFFGLLPWIANADIAEQVRSGNVAVERLRPIDTWAAWFSRALGQRIAAAGLRALPMWLVAGVALPLLGLAQWGLQPPDDIPSALLFALSMALAAVLACTIATLFDVIVVATLSDRGINLLAPPLVMLLSGMVVPLPLFPQALQTILFVQPCAGLVDIPYRIYFGGLTGSQALLGIALQLFWIVLLALLGRALLERSMARLQVQGG